MLLKHYHFLARLRSFREQLFVRCVLLLPWCRTHKQTHTCARSLAETADGRVQTLGTGMAGLEKKSSMEQYGTFQPVSEHRPRGQKPHFTSADPLSQQIRPASAHCARASSE